MANNTTIQNNVVTAGKFVTIGTGMSTSKQALRAIASAVAIEDQSATYREVQNIASGGITKEEKITLRELYEEITQRYRVVSSSVSQVGYIGDDWDLVNDKFNELEDEFRRILLDMNSDFNEQTNIGAMVENYIAISSAFATSLTAYIASADGYTIVLSGPSSPLKDTDNLSVSMSIFDPNGVQYAMSKSETDTIKWYLTGTNDDSANVIKGINPLVLTPTEWIPMFVGRSVDINATITIYPS